MNGHIEVLLEGDFDLSDREPGQKYHLMDRSHQEELDRFFH